MDNFCLIELTRGYTAIVDNQDSDLASMNWMAVVTPGAPVYAARAIKINGKQVKVSIHVIVLERTLGRRLVAGELCDHKDGSGLNNTRGNLRLANSTQNARNRKTRTDSKTGAKGVTFHKQTGKWRPYIVVNGKLKSLGLYDDLEIAISTRKRAEEEYFEEFSPTLSREHSRIVVYDNDPQRSLQALKQILSKDDLIRLANLIGEM